MFENLYNRIPMWKRISLARTYQNPAYHPEIYVDKHIKQVFQNVVTFWDSDVDLLMCAIFHDITKDEKWQKKVVPVIKGKTSRLDSFKLKVSNIGHEHTAQKYIDEWKHLYDDLNVNWEKVNEVVKHHLRGHLYVSNDLKKKHKRNAFEELTYFKDIIKFEVCDAFNPIKNNVSPQLIIKKQNSDTITILNNPLFNDSYEPQNITKLIFAENHCNKNYIFDYNDENGYYSNKCNICNATFMGNKHRLICNECNEQ